MRAATTKRAFGITAAVIALLAAAAAVAFAGPGSSGVGDPIFPKAGNGGYDVSHYDLTLSYDPADGMLDGRAGITRERRARPRWIASTSTCAGSTSAR